MAINSKLVHVGVVDPHELHDEADKEDLEKLKNRFTINSLPVCTWIMPTNPSLVPY